MKTNFLTLAAAIGFAAMTGTGYSQELRENGTVPFDFQVGTQHLSAGTYTVSRATVSGAMQLQNSQNHTNMVAPLQIPIGMNKQHEAKLVFHKYGERYFLAEVWFDNDPIGHALPKSKVEKEYAAQMHVTKPQVVYLAMR